MKVLSILAFVLLGVNAQNSVDIAEGVERKELPRILCGRILADARMLYCFSSNDNQKRSSDSTSLASIYPHSGVESWPWLARSYLLRLAVRGKRDRGLVDECCYKPCYVSELLNYC